MQLQTYFPFLPVHNPILPLLLATIIKRYVERFQVAEAIARAEVVECLRKRILCCIKASLVHGGAAPSSSTTSLHPPPPLGKSPQLVAPRWRISKLRFFIFCVCQSALNYSVKKCETLARAQLLLQSCDPVVNKHCGTWTDMACKGFSGPGSGSDSGDLCL